jgi:hypothetical protein
MQPVRLGKVDGGWCIGQLMAWALRGVIRHSTMELFLTGQILVSSP